MILRQDDNIAVVVLGGIGNLARRGPWAVFELLYSKTKIGTNKTNKNGPISKSLFKLLLSNIFVFVLSHDLLKLVHTLANT